MSLFSSLLFKIFIVPIIGGAMGLAAMIGLVYSQTAPPAENPVSDPILNYGDTGAGTGG